MKLSLNYDIKNWIQSCCMFVKLDTKLHYSINMKFFYGVQLFFLFILLWWQKSDTLCQKQLPMIQNVFGKF